MFEAGRTDLMLAAGLRVVGSPVAVVIVRLEIDFRHEMNWPGDVLIQTGIARIGQKSIHTRQRIFSADTLAAEGAGRAGGDRPRDAPGHRPGRGLAAALRTVDVAGVAPPGGASGHGEPAG